MKKTLRLTIPEWHGGVNPDYVFGSRLLSFIAPENEADEQIEIKVDTDFDRQRDRKDGIDCGEFLLEQMQETRKVLHEKQPDHVIVFGGDCSVSQVPFDYLSEKYGEKLGIIWLDAHPDISGINDSSHLHEMVLGDLLGLQEDSPLTHVQAPVSKERVMMAGLIEERLRDMDRACRDMDLRIASPEELKRSSAALLEWIKEEDITKLAIHWDLDVLTPDDFRCIYPAEPYTDPKESPAAVGRLTLKDVSRILNDVSQEAEIVGLTIAEHLPWDAMNLRKTLASVSIFQN